MTEGKATEKKMYTFFNGVKAVKKDGGFFTSVTVDAHLMYIERKRINENYVITARFPINNRAMIINHLLETKYNDDDTIWVQASFWDKRAERMEAMLNRLGNPDRLRLVLTGSMGVSIYTNQLGEAKQAVNMMVFDWIPIPSNNANTGDFQTAKESQPTMQNTGDFQTAKESQPTMQNTGDFQVAKESQLSMQNTGNTNENFANAFDDDGFADFGDVNPDDLPF